MYGNGIPGMTKQGGPKRPDVVDPVLVPSVTFGVLASNAVEVIVGVPWEAIAAQDVAVAAIVGVYIHRRNRQS